MQSPVLKGHLFLVLSWNISYQLNLLSGHLSYQATFSLPPKRPLNIGLTVYKKNSIKNRY